MFGHGSGFEDQAKFNIVGPDMTGKQFASLLNAVLVGTDAEAADRHQALGFREYLGRDLGLAPDAEQVNIGGLSDQLLLGQRRGQAFHLETVGRKHFLGTLVDVLQEQHFDLLFGEGRGG
jgi:hypothetical protein